MKRRPGICSVFPWLAQKTVCGRYLCQKRQAFRDNSSQIWDLISWRNKLIETVQPSTFQHSLLSNCQLCGSMTRLAFDNRNDSIANHCYSPVHCGVVIMSIVIEIRIRFPISFVDIIELISIAMRNDVPVARSKPISIAELVVESASNVGLDLVVLSLINVGWFVICSVVKKKKNYKKKSYFLSIIDSV